MSLSVRTRRTVGDSYAGHDAGNVDRADAENEGVHLVRAVWLAVIHYFLPAFRFTK